VSTARLRAAGGIREQIPSLVPDLAIEVLSPSNRPGEMRRKREHSFENGVRLVWEIDPKSRTAEVFKSAHNPIPIPTDGTLKGGDVLPGFELRLSDLFAAADKIVNA
jgi:Uma2 family endonuclease